MNESNDNGRSWLERARSWPQKKKLNFMFICAGIIVLLLIIAWVLVGNYRPSGGRSASGTISGIVNSIKNKDH